MATEVQVDSLISSLKYEADTEVIAKANKAIDELDGANKQAAVSVDRLSTESAGLTRELDALKTKSENLRDAQLKLKREIGDSKPTADQKKELRALSRELQEVGQETRKVRRDLSQLNKAERNASKSAKSAASAKKQLASAVKQAEVRMKSATKETQGLDAGLTQLAKGGLLVAGAQKALSIFTDLARHVFETAGRFQQLQASLVTVTGSASKADAAFAGIREFASETPFQVGQISEAFIKLKALGLDPSDRALKSYGNTASAMGKDLNMMVEAVADATVGEFERLKEFGIKASSQGKNVALTFRGTTTTIGKNAEEIQEFLLGLGETDFAGAMEKQMATLPGKFSNLQDKVDGFLVRIGELGAVEAFGDAIGELSERLTEQGAQSLADVTTEGVGVFQEALDEFDAETIEGILKALVALLKLLAFALSPLIKGIGFFADQLAALGEAASFVGDTLGDLFDAFKSGASATDVLANAFDSVTTSIDEVAIAAAETDRVLMKLVSGAVVKKAEELGQKLKNLGQEQIQAASDLTLRQLSVSESPAIAEAARGEIAAREATKQVEAQAELKGFVGGDKFKTKGLKTAEKNIDENAAAFGEEVFEDLVAGGMSPDAANERAAVMAGTRKASLLAQFNATGEVPKAQPKKKKGKAKQNAFEKQIFGQIDKLSKQAGERALGRGIVRAQAGEITSQEAIAGAEQRRKDVRQKLISEFNRTGQLPPGMQADVRQLQRLPSVEEAVGQVAPPTIVVTTIAVDAKVENMNIAEGGTFSGTARENAREINKMIDERMSTHISEAITSVLPKEVR